MSRYTEQIKSLTQDLESINQSLTSKEVGEADTFSGVAEKIRGIETTPTYKVIVDFGSHFGENITHRIIFDVSEEQSSGTKVLAINETKKPSTQSQYEYSFSTTVDTIYIDSKCRYGNGIGGLGTVKTLSGLKGHKTIKITATPDGIGSDISFAD